MVLGVILAVDYLVVDAGGSGQGTVRLSHNHQFTISLSPPSPTIILSIPINNSQSTDYDPANKRPHYHQLDRKPTCADYCWYLITDTAAGQAVSVWINTSGAETWIDCGSIQAFVPDSHLRPDEEQNTHFTCLDTLI